MQTREATRQLSELDRGLLLDRIKMIVSCMESGDVDKLLEFLAPEVVCFPPTTWRRARYRWRIVGKEALREAFGQRHINYVTLDSSIHRILIDGDEACVHRSTTIRERGSGVHHSFDCIDLLRFRDGLLVEFVELPDGSAYNAVINFPH